MAHRRAQIRLGRQVAAAAQNEAAGLAVLAVQLVQVKRFESHFLDVAEHVVQPDGVGLEQATELELAIGRL
ncbi:hypothetical protein D3C84_1179140 [compost metagenome]